MEDETAEILVAQMRKVLVNKDASTYVVTVHTGSAEPELDRWRELPATRRRLPSSATFVTPMSLSPITPGASPTTLPSMN